MKFDQIIVALTVAVLLATSKPSAAQTRSETVHFKSGASSTTMSGSIKGYEVVRFALGAKVGQMVHVLFSGDNGACYFNFIESGATSAVHMGEIAGNEFSKRLEHSGSSHAEVYMMRSAARRNEVCNYKITFEITG